MEVFNNKTKSQAADPTLNCGRGPPSELMSRGFKSPLAVIGWDLRGVQISPCSHQLRSVKVPPQSSARKNYTQRVTPVRQQQKQQHAPRHTGDGVLVQLYMLLARTSWMLSSSKPQKPRMFWARLTSSNTRDTGL